MAASFIRVLAALAVLAWAGPSLAMVEHQVPFPASCQPYETSGSPSTTCVTDWNNAVAGAGCVAGAGQQIGTTRNTTATFPPYYTPSAFVQPVWSCVLVETMDWTITDIWKVVNPCAATSGQSISGTVDRVGEPSASNPPPQEVCYETCTYGLSSAVAATGLDGSELWSGSWVGTGDACTGGTTPTEGGTTGEGAATGEAGKPADEAQGALETSLQGMVDASIAQRSGGGSTSPVGTFWALPSWVTGMFVRQTTSCDLGIDLPVGAISQSLGDSIYFTDVCTIQQYADTYGNWFMWLCALIWSWAIVTRGGTIE